MSTFKYKKNTLYCEKVNLQKLAEKNSSPFYVYSKQEIIRNYKKLSKAFASVKPLICFSVKSNSNLSILKTLKEQGSGFDIVSGGELFRTQKIKTNSQTIVYAGVGKRDDEIEYALKSNILMFNCESINEIRKINFIAKELHKIAKIAVRINPDVDAQTHQYITTGKKTTKFGIAFFELEKKINEIKEMKNIQLSGVHIHIGSQITQPSPYKEAITKTLKFITQLQDEGFPIEYFNIGGGYGIQYSHEKVTPIEKFGSVLVPLLKKSGLKIILEPGRFIVGNAGALITKVLYNKRNLGKNFMITEAGMHNLIRPSLYQAYHEIIPLHTKNKKTKKVDIVGPICESGDFFAKDRKIETVQEGDYLAILSAGAYGFTMSSRYNSHPFIGEIMIDKDQAYTIRKPEKYSDLIKNEVII